MEQDELQNKLNMITVDYRRARFMFTITTFLLILVIIKLVIYEVTI